LVLSYLFLPPENMDNGSAAGASYIMRKTYPGAIDLTLSASPRNWSVISQPVLLRRAHRVAASF